MPQAHELLANNLNSVMPFPPALAELIPMGNAPELLAFVGQGVNLGEYR